MTKSGRALIGGIMNHLVKPFVESDVLDSIDLALSQSGPNETA